MTIIEAKVDPQRADELAAHYRDTIGGERSPFVLESFLLRDLGDDTVWRILTVWRHQAALDEYRASVPVPAGVAAFRAVGATPSPSLSEVVAGDGGGPGGGGGPGDGGGPGGGGERRDA